MIEILVAIILYFIVKWAVIIFLGIVALSLVIRLISYISNASSTKKQSKKPEQSMKPEQSRAPEHSESIEKTYEKNSIGDLLARNKADAARGDYAALIDTIADREAIKAIVDWFDDVVKQGKYYAIHETEPAEGEPNYAFVMDNKSGFNFKELACEISVMDGAKPLGNVTGVARNWDNNTEGKIWFYCAGKVNKATIDVRSLKYVIDKDTDIEDNSDDFEYTSESDNRYEPYICPECFEPYDGIYCENCGHSNDEPGNEEISDDEKWIENLAAIAMFDAEDRKKSDTTELDNDDDYN